MNEDWVVTLPSQKKGFKKELPIAVKAGNISAKALVEDRQNGVMIRMNHINLGHDRKLFFGGRIYSYQVSQGQCLTKSRVRQYMI